MSGGVCNPVTHFLKVMDYETGAIKSDAGVQGLPCVEWIKQGKPCTLCVISNFIRFMRITC